MTAPAASLTDVEHLTDDQLAAEFTAARDRMNANRSRRWDLAYTDAKLAASVLAAETRRRAELAAQAAVDVEIPEAARTQRNSPAWFGLHRPDPNATRRVETTQRATYDSNGTPLGGTVEVRHEHATCLDCGSEYRVTPGSVNPACPVNQPAHQARIAEIRRRAGL